MSSKTKASLGLGVLVVIAAVVGTAMYFANDKENAEISNFRQCVDAGGNIAESFPEQCMIEGKSFENPEQRKQLDEQAGNEKKQREEERSSRVVNELPEATITLSEANDSGGTGNATRSAKNGEFKLNVNANLPGPASGKSYEVFLSTELDGDTLERDIVPVGQLQQKNGKWTLEYTSQRDLGAHIWVYITEESSVEDRKDVLSGKF